MHTVRQARLGARRLMSWIMVALLIITMALSAALLPRARVVLAQASVVSIQRVSVPGPEGDLVSRFPSLNADGRYVAFMSLSGSLVPDDGNSVRDIFVRDRQTGEISRVSIDSDGNESDGDSYLPSISADGRYVAFQSSATNLVGVGSDNNSVSDVFVHDRQTGVTTRVSVHSDGTEGDGDSNTPSISADGRYVAFESWATNLVDDDSINEWDIFVHDRDTGVTTRVSVHSDGTQGDDESLYASISADGRYVAFQSYASNLVTSDNNDAVDIFVRDRLLGETTRVSVGPGGAEGNGDSYNPRISADGRYVAFESGSDNLVASDNNSVHDIFVHDRQTGVTTRVNLDSFGVEADDESFTPISISADGRYVAFPSYATNLVAGDDNGVGDIFVHDRQTETTTRVSVDSAGLQADDYSEFPSISADGRYVAFESGATNLVAGDNNGDLDVFVHDLQTTETTRVSSGSGTEADSDSWYPCMSADGRYVAFASGASNLVAGDTNNSQDVFVRDRQTGETTRVSLDSNGNEGDSYSNDPCISADGRYVAFCSGASNLDLVTSDNNGVTDVYVHDRQTGQTARASLSSSDNQSNNNCFYPSISADGRYVVFYSSATNLVDDDTNSMADVFVRDRQAGQTTRVSVDSEGNQSFGVSFVQFSSISTDGRYVAFYSEANNLVVGDTNNRWDIFVHDRQTEVTTRVSVDSEGNQSDGGSYNPKISADGRYVAFESSASNLVEDDTNGAPDIFVHDRVTGVITRASLAYDGSQADGGYDCSISGDGRYVAFTSAASDLVTGDTNSRDDIFVRDLSPGGTTIRVSTSADGTQANNQSQAPSISADGRYVVFHSSAANLVLDDANGYQDAFVVSWENPALAYAPTSIDFGVCYENYTDNQTLQVQNAGTGTVSYSLSENSTWCSLNPASGASTGETDNVSVDINTAGLSPGSYSCVILITSDGGVGIVPVHLSVQPRPLISVVPSSHDFGTVAIGGTAEQVFTVSNTGSGDLTIGNLAVADPLTAPFSIVSDNCSGQTILPGDNCTLTVRFSPTAKGVFNDSFDIPSNDPDTPSVTVTLSGATPNTPPPAPVIAVTPENPTTVDNLVCTIVTQATDVDGDPITYTYQWYKDDVLQPMLNTNTVGAAATAKGQVWKCVVTPHDGMADGPTAEDAVTVQNTAPTAPVVTITPASPGISSDLVCGITTASTDADSDAVTYTYQWYKDGVVQSSLTTDTVPAANTALGEVWRCVVTPSDGTVSGPSAENQVTIQNSAPTPPEVDVTPNSPATGDDLVCNMTAQSTDADGDTVTYTYQWYKDGELQSSLTGSTVPGTETAKGQVWKCVVTPSDGVVSGASGEDEVTIQNSAPTAPVVTVTPDKPGTKDDLVCGITTQSADADGDTVTYTYQWYKDGEVQSGLTANTVGAGETGRGQVWKCVVTPNDGTAGGPTAQDEVTVAGSAGGFPVGAIVGIVFGVLVVAGAAAFFWFRRSKKAP